MAQKKIKKQLGSQVKKVKKTVSKKPEVTTAQKAKIRLPINILKSPVVKIVILILAVALGVVVIDYSVQLFNNSQAAIVNGNRIPMSSLNSRLQVLYGSDIIEPLIKHQIILDEARKNNVTVTQQEIDDKYQNYITLSGSEEELINQYKSYAGISEKADIQKDIKVQLLASKLVKSKVKEPTEEEIQKYYESVYASVKEDKPKYEEVKAELKEKLVYFNEQNEIYTLLDELQQKATIQNNLTEKPALKFLGLSQTLVKKILNRQ